MKKFYPVRIVETREAVVALEGESFEEVKEKMEKCSREGRALNVCNSSVNVYRAGLESEYDEVCNTLQCFTEAAPGDWRLMKK